MNDIVIVSFQSLNGKDVAGPGKLGYYLASGFHDQGRLSNFIVSSKGKFTTSFPSSPVSFWSRYYLFVLNKLWKTGLLKYHRKRYLEELFFDFFLFYRVDRNCRVLVSMNPYLIRTLNKCKKLGIKTFLIPANPEENEINSLLSQARKKWKVNENETDVYTYRPRVEMYNRSVPKFDRIIAHTSVIKTAFEKWHPDRKIIPCYGLIWAPHQGEVSESTPSPHIFKVMYLAHTILLKGLQDLLEAWAQLDTGGAELYIGGEIDSLVSEIIDTRFQTLQNVKFCGHIADVSSFLQEASLFVCPSLADAVPITVLEAAAKGIPSIITENCGVKDVLVNNRTAFILRAADEVQLANCLKERMADKGATLTAGRLARASLKELSFDDFLKRLSSTILEK